MKTRATMRKPGSASSEFTIRPSGEAAGAGSRGCHCWPSHTWRPSGEMIGSGGAIVGRHGLPLTAIPSVEPVEQKEANWRRRRLLAHVLSLIRRRLVRRRLQFLLSHGELITNP